MFRRVVVNLVIALLVGQACFAVHAHAEASSHDPAGMFRPPHFHLRVFFPPVNNRDRNAPIEHDSDAVYLPDASFSGWCPNPSDGAVDLPAAMPPAEPLDIAAIVSVSTPLQEHAMPAGISPCPLYLLSASLLI
jgi:hypothetical protein